VLGVDVRLDNGMDEIWVDQTVCRCVYGHGAPAFSVATFRSSTSGDRTHQLFEIVVLPWFTILSFGTFLQNTLSALVLAATVIYWLSVLTLRCPALLAG
jgi:hypothetical protein